MLRHGIPYQRYVRAATSLYGTAKQAYKLGGRAGQLSYDAFKGAKYIKGKYFKSNPSPPGSPDMRALGKRKRSPRAIANASRAKGGTAVSKFRKTKRVVRRRRKSYKKKGRANLSNAVISRVECTQKVADLQAVYVGHSTVATQYVNDRVSDAVAKAFLMKEGFAPRAQDETFNLNVGTYFRITYYSSPTSTTAAALDSGLIPANTAFTQYSLAVKGLLQSVIDLANKRMTFVKMSFFSDPAVGANYRFWHEFNMNGIHLQGFTRSQFSMQNSTPNAIGTTNTDVNNNNPLRITKYAGKGNGTFWRNRTDVAATFTGLFANPTTAAIAVLASEANGRVLDEPPSSKHFLHAKKVATSILQPGDIKTESLYMPINMSLVKYINSFDGYPETDLVRQNFGKFAFYGCEKVLSTNIGVPANNASNVKVTIDYELDFACQIACTMKKSSSPMAPINTSIIIGSKGVS